MIEDQSQIESRETECAIAIDSAMLDFLDTVSVSGNSPIFAVTWDATRNARGYVSAPAIAVPTTFVEERTIPVGPLGSILILVVRITRAKGPKRNHDNRRVAVLSDSAVPAKFRRTPC
jgi:hypothetical protein